MSARKARLRALAQRLNAGAQDGFEPFFTADFQIHTPTGRDWPRGPEAAKLMAQNFATLGDDLKLEALDMVEEGDRVAVRWAVSWLASGERRHSSILTIYRFEGERIAEDWGLTAPSQWP